MLEFFDFVLYTKYYYYKTRSIVSYFCLQYFNASLRIKNLGTSSFEKKITA